MDGIVGTVKTMVYDKCSFEISGFLWEPESRGYEACQFQLNGKKIICRNAKVTPKRIGQFVTFWKRIGNGTIEPFNERDEIDLYVVNVRTDVDFGQFVFPKSVLIKKGIISTDNKEGKRAFRVYPIWDKVVNKQAVRAQEWQLNYFYLIEESMDYAKTNKLYGTN